jgi:hypothetical protein
VRSSRHCALRIVRGFFSTLNGYPFTNLVYGYGGSSGALQQLPGFPVATGGQGTFGTGLDDASDQLAYDTVKHRLYVINFTSNTLSAFSVNPATGALTAMPFSPIALPPGVWGGVRVHPSASAVIVGATTLRGTGLVAVMVTPTMATQRPAACATPATFVFSGAFSRDGPTCMAG